MRPILQAIVTLLCCGAVAVRAQIGAPLHLKQTIALPGVEGRIDHLALDTASDRLFVCALGNNTVEVLDLRKGLRIHSITGLGTPQGIAYIPELNRLFVANDKDGICNFYDGRTFVLLRSTNFEDDADNARYDSVAKRIYVGFGNGGLGILDPDTGRELGRVKLSGHPEAFVLEKQGSRIFVNVPTARQVAVVDRAKGEVIAAWKTDEAYSNFPMALDESNHRLFIGCRRPAKIVVLNTESGAIVTTIGIAGDIDDIFYDSRRHRLYAICGGGEVDVIDQVDPDTYKLSFRTPTVPGARTGLFVAESSSLFVALPHRGNQKAELRRYSID